MEFIVLVVLTHVIKLLTLDRGYIDFSCVLKGEIKKMGTLKKMGDPKTEKGPYGDPGPQMEIHLVCILIKMWFWYEQTDQKDKENKTILNNFIHHSAWHAFNNCMQ